MNDPMSHLAQAVKSSIEIHQLKVQLEEIPVKVREIESSLKIIAAEYQEKKSAWESVDNQKRKLVGDLQAEKENLQQKEARLNAIKTPKEYQAVVREITTAKTTLREWEEKISALEKEVEAFQTELSPLEEKIAVLEKEQEEESASIQGSLDELKSKVVALETKLSEELAALPSDVKSTYYRIAEQKQPPAAAVLGGTCQECFMQVPPQLFIEIQKKHEVRTCPNCYRLLYIEED